MSDPWIWRCDRTIPSDTRSGRHVLDEMLQQLEGQHWGQHDIFGVHLAVEEALVNAIMHGNRLDANKQVRVVCLMWPNRVRIEISDEGRGFSPQAVPDPTCPERLHAPSGRGMMLMKAFMSRVEYNELGNHVVLEKDRAGASGRGRE